MGCYRALTARPNPRHKVNPRGWENSWGVDMTERKWRKRWKADELAELERVDDEASPECGSCRYFRLDEDSQLIGRCHRFPPAIGPGFDVSPFGYRQGCWHVAGRRTCPEVVADFWCGEWRRRT